MKPKILLYDIETSPLLTYTWGIYEQNAIKVLEDFKILCFAYKWLGESKVHVVAQNDFKGYKPGVNEDSAVVRALHGLFEEADVVIAHNGDSFDQKKAQARMIVHGLTPPAPYKQIDTKKVAKRYARFDSNKLDDLARQLGLERKGETGGFETWEGCMAGDNKAWKKMKQYNKQDVTVLEEVYLKLRPWIRNHPAMNLLTNRLGACPTCGEGPLQRRGYTTPTRTGVRQRFVCTKCGAWGSSRLTENRKPEYVTV